MASKKFSEVFKRVREFIAVGFGLPVERTYYGGLPENTLSVQFPCAVLEVESIEFLYHTRGRYSGRVWSIEATLYSLDDPVILFRLLDRLEGKFDEQQDIVKPFSDTLKEVGIESISSPVFDDVFIDSQRVIGITVTFQIMTV